MGGLSVIITGNALPASHSRAKRSLVRDRPARLCISREAKPAPVVELALLVHYGAGKNFCLLRSQMRSICTIGAGFARREAARHFSSARIFDKVSSSGLVNILHYKIKLWNSWRFQSLKTQCLLVVLPNFFDINAAVIIAENLSKCCATLSCYPSTLLGQTYAMTQLSFSSTGRIVNRN